MQSHDVTPSANNWRSEVHAKGPPLKITSEQSRTVTFLDEGTRSMGNKYGTEEKNIPQVEFQVYDEDQKENFTWYVKLSSQNTLNQIVAGGTPLKGKKVKITRNGVGIKTRYTVLF